MKVSVIITCYNLGTYIKDAVSSVQKQTYTDYEIIVVDDGSTDAKTTRILRGLERGNVKIYRIKNRKLPGARNYGIKKAKGDYIVCLDADDKLANHYIEKTATILDKDEKKELGFVTTWIQEFGGRSSIWKTSEFNVPELLVQNVIQVASMFRKDVWTETGGYNENLNNGYEDWDFWLRIVEKGYKWVCIPEPLFYYRIRKGSMLSESRDFHLDLYRTIFNLYRPLFTKHSDEVILESARAIHELRKTIVEKDKAIKEDSGYREKYRKEVEQLRERVLKLEEELDSLKNSSIVGPAIKLRQSVNRVRGEGKRLG